MLIFYYFLTKTTKFSTSYIPSYIFISPPASMNTNADTQDNFSSSQSKSVWEISVLIAETLYIILLGILGTMGKLLSGP